LNVCITHTKKSRVLFSALRFNSREWNKLNFFIIWCLYIYVYQSNSESRIFIDKSIWSIDAVYPLPELKGGFTEVPDTNNIGVLLNKIYLGSYYSAKRLTSEEWNENRGNPFSHGNTIQNCSSLEPGSSDLVDFGYLDEIKYNNSTGTHTHAMIEVRPYIPKKPVAIAMIVSPPEVTLISDSIPFNDNLKLLIVSKVVEYLSFQEGDKTSVFQISNFEISNILNSIK